MYKRMTWMATIENVHDYRWPLEFLGLVVRLK